MSKVIKEISCIVGQYTNAQGQQKNIMEMATLQGRKSTRNPHPFFIYKER